MITAEFEYQSPATLKEALKLLKERSDSAKIISGGMSLVPMMTLGLVGPETLISLRKIPELHGVREERKAIVIGAMTPHAEVAEHALVHEYAPLLAETAGLIGDVQVRNRGTIGGSIAHADPAANYPAAVIALDAEIEVASARKKRKVPASDFFAGLMMTVLEEGEIVTAIHIPKRKGAWGSSFQKFTRVKGNFPIVCAAALVDAGNKEARVVIGGVCVKPVRIEVSETDDASLAEAIRASIDDPLADANGSADYKTEMAVVYGVRAVVSARGRVQ